MLRALLTACAVTSLRSTRSATAGPVRHLLHRLALLGPAAQSCFLAMSFALLYAAVRFLLDALLISRRSESRLQAEVLALRDQLRVLPTPGPSSALAACRSALPERPQPPPAISLLVISAPQPGDSAAMASRTGPTALGSLPIAAVAPATHRSTRPPRDHR